jgi:hypothetical protein
MKSKINLVLEFLLIHYHCLRLGDLARIGCFSFSLSNNLDTENSCKALLSLGVPLRIRPLGIFPSDDYFLMATNISLFFLNYISLRLRYKTYTIIKECDCY